MKKEIYYDFKKQKKISDSIFYLHYFQFEKNIYIYIN